MVHKERSKRYLSNIVGNLEGNVTGDTTGDITGSVNGMNLLLGAATTTVTEVSATLRSPVLRQENLTVTALVVAITSALDYGSESLITFPNTNILILASQIDLVGTEDGVGITDPENVDISLGTVAAANNDLSGAGETDLIAAFDVGAVGVSKDNNSAALSGLFIPAGASNRIYLNAIAALSADGTMSFTGTVRIVYLDLGT